jgi:AraC-like DNA-binding protein
MQNVAVPRDVKHQQQINAGEISFVYYREKDSAGKNRVVFSHYAISFVLNGQKELYRSAGNTVIGAHQGILIPGGHSIIAERTLNDDLYSSLIAFFPKQLATRFMEKKAIGLHSSNQPKAASPYILFSRTPYLNEYLRNLIALITSGQQLSDAMALHKLEELFLTIYELFPEQFISLFSEEQQARLSLKNLIEENLFNNLTIDELAFLANRSLSSFKRDFEQLYQVSPQRYIRERKLEIACAELLKGKPASELYHVYGYDNPSNFNTAFKKRYGLTPLAYRNSQI